MCPRWLAVLLRRRARRLTEFCLLSDLFVFQETASRPALSPPHTSQGPRTQSLRSGEIKLTVSPGSQGPGGSWAGEPETIADRPGVEGQVTR